MKSCRVVRTCSGELGEMPPGISGDPSSWGWLQDSPVPCAAGEQAPGAAGMESGKGERLEKGEERRIIKIRSN